MRKTALKALFFTLWALSGTGFFLIFPRLETYYRDLYSLKERYFLAPVAAPDHQLRIRSDSSGKGYFGASRNKGRTHEGIDLVAPVGEPIVASKTGRVSAAGPEKGYGLYIEIRHPDGLLTRYAHLSEVLTCTGEWVNRGQLIGKSGKSGNASDASVKPHLHFEIKKGRTALDPTSGLMDPTLRIRG